LVELVEEGLLLLLLGAEGVYFGVEGLGGGFELILDEGLDVVVEMVSQFNNVLV
jgi:hypothetical protein